MAKIEEVNVIQFDTMEAVDRLTKKGFELDQAREIVSVVRDSQLNLVSKDDLKLVYIAIVASPFLPRVFDYLVGRVL